jgi:hypothetical protein
VARLSQLPRPPDRLARWYDFENTCQRQIPRACRQSLQLYSGPADRARCCNERHQLIEQGSEAAAPRESNISEFVSGNLPAEFPEPWERGVGRRRQGVLAFAATTIDQGMVSFSNFGATILVGRFLGPTGFGIFTLVWSVACFLMSSSNLLSWRRC